jgi:translocation and assembly module TamB
LSGLFTVEDGSVNIKSLLIEKGPYRATASGVLPLKALSERAQTGRSDEMDIKIQLDNANLSILPLIFKNVTSAYGDADGFIELTGTLAAPKANGRISIDNNKGFVQLAGIADPIEKIGVDIIFKDDTISIDKFDGQMRGGSYSLTGTALIKGLGVSDYNLSLLADKLRIRHRYFDGVIDANLSLSDKGTNSKPLLAGNIHLENTIIDIPSVPQDQADSPNIEFDVDVNIGRKVRLYNPRLFDLLVTGRVRIGGTAEQMRLSGRIESRRGSITYLMTRFNVIEASADFFPHQGMIPTVRLETRARAGRTHVMLNIGGTADNMELRLTSDPPMSNENIIRLLTLGYDSSLGQDSDASQTSNFWTIGLQMQAAATVEGMLRNTIGIDEFRIEPATMFEYRGRRFTNRTNHEYYGYNLKIGKYLTDSFIISYSTALDHTSNSFTIQYDINRRTTVSGTFGGLNNGLFTVESRFRF